MSRADGHDRLLVRQHRISQGAPVAHEVVRAAALRLANALARATTGGPARARIASRRGAERRPAAARSARSARSARATSPRWPTSPTASSASFELAARRGDRAAQPERVRDGLRRARVRRRARAARRLRSRRRARPRGARREPELASIRRSATRGPIPGCRRRWPASATLLEGSEVEARDLQDPLTFRTIAQQNGAARDALAFVGCAARDRAQRGAVEPARRRRRGQGHLGRQLRDAAARDRARLSPGSRSRPVISTAAERAVKLLQRHLTGLHRGPRRPARRWPRARSASTASRSRRSPSRRACSPSPSRSTSSRRPRPRGSRTG